MHDPDHPGAPIQLWAWGDSTGANGPIKADAFQVKIAREKGQIRYEWRVDLGKLGPGTTRLRPGRSIGFDLSIWDVDADNSASWIAWSPGPGKWNTASQLGDMLLLAGGEKMATLRGQITWQKPRPGPLPRHVRLQSTEDKDLWIQARADSTGYYEASLPLGRYAIAAVDATELRLVDGPGVEVVLSAIGPVDAPLLRAIAMPNALLAATKPEGALYHLERANTDSLDRILRAGMAYYKIPGMSLALITDGKIVHQRGYGVQDADGDEPVKATTLFEAASMTKPVFAYTVARLVERGVLAWDTPLYTYWPYEDIAYDERYKLITARMVVSHTTGFPNWRSGKLTIQFTPGTQFGYSGEGFEYLGKVVVHLTGKELIDLIGEEVFAPMGMDNAYLVWNETSYPPKAMAHTSGDLPASRQEWGAPNMAASLHVDAGTYAQFLIAVSKGLGLSQATLAEMMRPQTKIPDEPMSFGLGFALEESPHGLLFGHGGNNNGFTSNSAFDPDAQTGYVMLVNSDQANDFRLALHQYLLTGKTEPNTTE